MSALPISSLVKFDDEKKTGTSAIWRDIREMLDKDYPEAAMVSEWSDPPVALKAGFDMDFYLNCPGNGYSSLMRDYEPVRENDHSYFKKDGDGDINRFLDEYLKYYENSRDAGYISMLTCNHDTNRPRYTLGYDELKIAYAFIFTMPGVPFLYYGDEIGMRYLDYIPTKEGGYSRTGSRTPMQWKKGKNLGFSEGCEDSLYLPVDSASDAPTVEEQEKDPDSLLNTVKKLLALRHSVEDLQADAAFEVLCSEKGKPFVYKRGSLTIAVNPSDKEVSADISVKGEKLYETGSAALGDKLTLSPQTFVIIR